jgi:hypothetical protein
LRRFLRLSAHEEWEMSPILFRGRRFSRGVEAASPAAILALPASVGKAVGAGFPFLQSKAPCSLAGMTNAAALAVSALF